MKKYSKYRGVGITCPTQRWQARICFQGRRMFLGTFDTERAAARAYVNAERHFYGGQNERDPYERMKEDQRNGWADYS